MPVLDDLFNIYHFPTGRRTFAQLGVQEVAKDLSLADLSAHITAVLEQEAKTRELELAWLKAKNPLADPALVNADRAVDRSLAALFGVVESWLGLEDIDEAKAKAARRIERACFAGGVAALTQVVLEEEASAVDVIVGKLQGDLAADVGKLQGAPLVAKLKADNATLKEALAKREAEEVSFDQVRAARARGQENLLVTVAMILGAFPSTKPEATQKRDRLLAPIWEQQEAIRRQRRRREKPTDIDPQSGAPLPPPVTVD